MEPLEMQKVVGCSMPVNRLSTGDHEREREKTCLSFLYVCIFNVRNAYSVIEVVEENDKEYMYIYNLQIIIRITHICINLYLNE